MLRTTVAGVTGGTYVSMCPTAQTVQICRATSTRNAQAGRDTSHLAIVPRGHDRSVRIYVDAGALIALFDVVGFVRPTAVYSLLVPTTPIRWGPEIDNGPALPMTALPDDATGLVLNVTGSAVSGRMYVSVCPYGDPVACSRTSVLNPPTAAYLNSRGTVTLLSDVLGYLVPAAGRLGG